MTSCPSCESHRVFRSKTRGAFERFRRQFTMKRPVPLPRLQLARLGA